MTLSEASRANLGYGKPGESLQTRARVFEVIRRGFGFGPKDATAGDGKARVSPARGPVRRHAKGSGKQ